MTLFHRCLLILILSPVWTTYVSATEQVVIASGKGPGAPVQPQLTLDSMGSAHLVYGVGDAVYYANSEDGGQSFTRSLKAFRVPNMSLGMRRGPRIAASGKAVVVSVIGGAVGKGRDGNLVTWSSEDKGATWQGPVQVNDVDDACREGLHAMAAGDDGTLWCVWLDLRNKKSEIWATRSRDAGRSWDANVCVYRSPDGSVCECCHPSVIVRGKSIHVLFRNSVGGDRDMYVTSSTDDGNTFAEAIKLGQGSWTLDACPMDGGMLATDVNGKIMTVWRRDDEVFSAKGDGSKETSHGKGHQPWITSSSDGPIALWTLQRAGDLMLLTPGSSTPVRLAGNARDPMVASLSGGSGPVIACWESKNGDQSEIVAMSIETRSLKKPVE